uniref:Uncharacterized protein n=1 Tax=Anguilla anguilla TaxID=7936 RepID=A0A0E9R0Q8_ANGAN
MPLHHYPQIFENTNKTPNIPLSIQTLHLHMKDPWG